MKTTKYSKSKTVINGIKILLILLCSIVGSYGIATAPESDQNMLEQELEQNAKALEDTERNHPSQQDGGQKSAQTGNIATANEETNSFPAKEIDPDVSPLLPQNPQTEGFPVTTEKPIESISVIGDSVFLGAAPDYQKLVPDAVIDAKISRQVYQGLDVAKKMDKKGKLGNTVLIALGTNGKFNEVTGQELIDYLGKDRRIYWITAYGKKLSWQKEVNQTIQKLAEKNENLSVVDWTKEAKKHPNWFYQDGTHLNTKGQIGYAKFIVKKTTKEPGM